MPKRTFFLVGYCLLLILYALFSYSLTHPSLVLTGFSPYWNFQTWMWRTFYDNRVLLSTAFTTLIVLMFGMYLGILKTTPQTAIKKSLAHFWPYLLFCLPLFFSYNALSSDVFNYIFNAKMVLVYQTNPHLDQAVNYDFDPWTRFMTNTYITAPYGYGWTVLSLIPYVIGLGKFLTTWLAFRGFSYLGVLFLFLSLQLFSRRWRNRPLTQFEFSLIFFNPLFLIEVLSNSHNDIWMLWPAVLSLALVVGAKLKPKELFASVLALGLSVWVKLITLALVPVWLALCTSTVTKKQLPTFLKPLIQRFQQAWPLLVSIGFVLMLTSPRSRQFHPWYLTWALVWLPFISWKPWKVSLIVLSLSAMLRYLPWLLTNLYTDPIELQQKAITWIPFVIVLILATVLSLFKSTWFSKTKTVQ